MSRLPAHAPYSFSSFLWVALPWPASRELLKPIPMFLTTYDRHVMRRFGLSYAILIVVLIVFFVVLHYVEYVDDFQDRGAALRDVFLVYYPNYVPEIVRLVSPLALFMACVILTVRLAQKNELTALETSGVPLSRLRRPFALLAVAVTAFMFWFNGWIVPATNQVRLNFELEYTKDAPRDTEFNNIHRQMQRGAVLTIGFFERSTATAHTVTLQRYDSGSSLLERIDSPRMQWIDSTSSWRLFTPVVRRFDAQGFESRFQPTFVDTTLVLLPRDLARTDGDVEAMSITEAREYIETLRRSGADHLDRPVVTYQSKLAYPLANLILVLLGVPLAGVRRRGGQAPVIAAGLGMAFVYLSLQKILEAFGATGAIPPMIAAWAPHVVFIAIAYIVMRRART